MPLLTPRQVSIRCYSFSCRSASYPPTPPCSNKAHDEHKAHTQAVRAQELCVTVEVQWTPWAPVPNKPTVSVDVKQHFHQSTP